MNSIEFQTELGKIIQRAFNEGVQQRKLSITELVGILELQKSDLIAWAQNAARVAAINQQQNAAALAEQIRKGFENGGRG